MTRDRNGRDPDESIDENLSAWLDGELDDAAVEELRAEIEERPGLAARLEQLRRVDEELRALPEPAVRPELAERLRERIAEEERAAPQPSRRRGSPAPPPRRRWMLPLLAAAAAAGLVFLALPRLRQTPPQEEAAVARAPTPESVAETIAPEPSPEASPDPAPAAEELALAIEIESEKDLEVIEMLEWLEMLGEIESG